MAKQKFPKVLYVRIDEDGDECYFISEARLADVVREHDRTAIGIYHLSETSAYEKVVSEAS